MDPVIPICVGVIVGVTGRVLAGPRERDPTAVYRDSAINELGPQRVHRGLFRVINPVEHFFYEQRVKDVQLDMFCAGIAGKSRRLAELREADQTRIHNSNPNDTGTVS